MGSDPLTIFLRKRRIYARSVFENPSPAGSGSRSNLCSRPASSSSVSEASVVFAVEALARAGVGTIDLVDNDTVCLTNINRQIIATHQSVGRYKTEVMAERIP